MSGMRGDARTNKVKLKARITFHDTGRTVTTNIFARITDNAFSIVDRIEAKYGKPLSVVCVKGKGRSGSILFAEPTRLAA